MFSFLKKLNFLIQKPPVVIVTGKGRKTATEAISKVLESVLIKDLVKEVPLQKLPYCSFWVRHSRKPVLVVTNVGEIPVREKFFAGPESKIKNIRKLIPELPAQGRLILNFDDETVRGLEDQWEIPALTFGLEKGADFSATDIKQNLGLNFKINYQGKVVPVWLENLVGREQIFAALAGAACGTLFGLNLVNISQTLKQDYFSVPGRQRLIEGIKDTLIFDDSATASVFSTTENLRILKKIKKKRRTVAVLGDILGIGKYSIEAHQALGRKVKKSCEILFTVGPRAKFIARGAQMEGFPQQRIFSFDGPQKAGRVLQEKIKKGDLILVDGSQELKMGKIVEEIREMEG